MKKYFSREIIIGAIAVISLAIFFFGINYLKGVNLFKPSNHYYATFNDVTDLQKTTPVYVDGFKVGVVNDISYDYNRPKNIVVQVSLDKSMKIQKGSYIELTSSLTTGASLHIVLNTHVTSYCAIGDTIEGKLRTGAMEMITKAFVPQIENMLPKIDSILIGLQNIITHPALTQSLVNIQRTSANLERSTAHLDQTMKDVSVILNNLKTASSDFTEVSSGLKSLDLTPAYNGLNTTINNIENLSNQLRNKDNNAGLLFNDKTLYDNLNTTIESASDLISDIKKNPKRYIRVTVF